MREQILKEFADWCEENCVLASGLDEDDGYEIGTVEMRKYTELFLEEIK